MLKFAAAALAIFVLAGCSSEAAECEAFARSQIESGPEGARRYRIDGQFEHRPAPGVSCQVRVVDVSVATKGMEKLVVIRKKVGRFTIEHYPLVD